MILILSFHRLLIFIILCSGAFTAAITPAMSEPLAASYPEPYILSPVYPQPDRISHLGSSSRPLPDDCSVWIVLSDREARSRFGPKFKADRSPAADYFSGLGSSVGISLTAGLYLLGNQHDRGTAVKALEAAFQANVLTGILKGLAGRERPYKTDGRSRFHGPWGHYDSFPSGHTATAFALATVLSHRQSDQGLLYESLAVLVGWSRIRKDSHFLSDVVAGAALGRYAGGQATR